MQDICKWQVKSWILRKKIFLEKNGNYRKKFEIVGKYWRKSEKSGKDWRGNEKVGKDRKR